MNSRRVFFWVNMRTSFEERILRGIARVAWEMRPRVSVRWGMDIQDGLRGGADGMVMFAMPPDQLELVRTLNLPVVATSTRNLSDGCPCVVTDDVAIGELAAKHYREKFYRSFAFLGPLGVGFGTGRRKAFARALAPDEVNLLELDGKLPLERRLAKLRRDLERLPPLTAIFAANDIFARMVLTQLEQSNRRVPEDLAVMGVDADELISLSCPMDLTSVDSNPEAIGEQAVHLLLRMLQKPGSVANDTVIRVPPAGIVEGASTDALATDDIMVLRARELMQFHACDREYSIDDLARETGCSRRSLELRFAAVTGSGIGRQLWNLRLDRSKELLSTTRLTLSEIAEQSGFVSHYHFSEKFKKETGVTPGQFRRKGGEVRG